MQVTLTGSDGFSFSTVGVRIPANCDLEHPCPQGSAHFTLSTHLVPPSGQGFVFDFTAFDITVPAPDIIGLTSLTVQGPVAVSAIIGTETPLTGKGLATLDISEHPAGNIWMEQRLRYDFELTPIPEPTTLLLFGTTAAGLGLARWRQGRRSKGTVAGNN